MTRLFQLKSVEKEYKQEIKIILEAETYFTVDNMIRLSEKLFTNIKVKSISSEEKENDMLLFQYGIYNWQDELGEHFSFNITRQFINNKEEIYQLSLTLVYDPLNFKGLKSYSSWSSDFNNIAEWRQNIQKTEGYKTTKAKQIKLYELTFGKV
jgi:hypothetical protein